MARNPAERRHPTWLTIFLFGLLGVGGVAAVAIIVPQMFLVPSSEVVLVKAAPGPFKEKPEDPGGAEIPHTDSTVMTMLGRECRDPASPGRCAGDAAASACRRHKARHG